MKVISSLMIPLLSAGMLLSLQPTFAQRSTDQNTKAHQAQNDSKKNALLRQIQPAATSSGQVTVEGKAISYNAVMGTLPIIDKNEVDTIAKMSFAAYFKKGVSDLTQRPITFFYNGGPGSATVWLHMGSLGPVRVVTDDTAHMDGAPYEVVNNEYSLLDASDLVFIDMPGTGFGRIQPGKEKDFYGVDQDASAFAQFIVRFITQYNRWNSPKYLFGESYGTTRSAVLANMLQRNYSVDLNGVILLSQILNFGNSVDGPTRNPGNDQPYILALPTYAATAWYHNKIAHTKNLRPFLDEVEHFAKTDYALALAKGSLLDEATFNQIAEKLHAYTGLPVNYIKRANLRIDGGEFEQNLLGDQNQATGRLDTRYSGPLMDPLAQRSFYDPQSSAISSAYISSFNDYVRNKMNYGKDMYYKPSVYGDAKWDWTHNGSRSSVNVMPDLARTMINNPKLRVMLNAGYYDLATPYFEGVDELQHLPIPKALTKNLEYAFYESGHMVYLHLPSLKDLHDNVKAFIEEGK